MLAEEVVGEVEGGGVGGDSELAREEPGGYGDEDRGGGGDGNGENRGISSTGVEAVGVGDGEKLVGVEEGDADGGGSAGVGVAEEGVGGVGFEKRGAEGEDSVVSADGDPKSGVVGALGHADRGTASSDAWLGWRRRWAMLRPWRH